MYEYMEYVWAQKPRFTSVREHHLLGGRWPWETRNNFIVLQIGSNYYSTLQMHVT